MKTALAEFVGVFFIMLCIGCNVSGREEFSDPLLILPTSVASMVMALYYGCPKAHFNPAVTLSLAVTRFVEWREVPIYIVSQVFGALAGCLCYQQIHSNPANFLAIHEHPRSEYYDLVVCQAIFSTMMCLVFLCVSPITTKNKKQFYGLAIGFVIIAQRHSVRKVFRDGWNNPAITFSIYTTAPSSTPTMLCHLLGEFLGVGLASMIHGLTFPEAYDKPGTFMAKLVAELVGTFFLVVTFACHIFLKTAMGPWAIAATLLCMMCAFGSSSGSHLNPAVTLALRITGRSVDEGSPLSLAAFLYVVAQFLGALIAALVIKSISGTLVLDDVAPVFESFTFRQLALAEAFFTGFLCFVMVSTRAMGTRDLTQVAGLIVGSCMTAAGFAVGAVSAALFNPAVTLGLVMAVPSWSPRMFFSYLAFQLFGTMLCCIFFMITRGRLSAEDVSSSRVGQAAHKAIEAFGAAASASADLATVAADALADLGDPFGEKTDKTDKTAEKSPAKESTEAV
eukprot:CAMPEP_0170577344 /NCGR_PEP_ID=MMETSP0224-20130122/4876_1 /TAXON_ID=285029 /ORGANISM="Togula jolla, Strain CCCM 725" /LENGTH=507 /DNA_ID=CAMNT_0010900247 /DNA_START=67 /DNA_END=1590 /DNA_ORIENTATION=-